MIKPLALVVISALSINAFAGSLSDKNQKVAYSTLAMRFLEVAPTPAETDTQRTVGYSVSTCLTNNRTGKNLSHIPVQIAYLSKDGETGEEPMELVTDSQGCITWYAYVWNPQTSANCFYERSLKITALGSESLFTTYMNPDDETPTFGFERREVGTLEAIGLVPLRLCRK